MHNCIPLFQLWRIQSAIRAILRLIWQVPLALLCRYGMKALSRADDIWFEDGKWYLEWLRDGITLSGSRAGVIIALIQERIHKERWVIKDAKGKLLSAK